jgi:2-phospho-L-lactate/phosphoenolpyruvate guanylyltransferase
LNDKIFAVVPVKRFETSKSRLKFFLTEESRMRLTELLLTDTISTLINSNSVDTIVIVSGDERARLIGTRMGAKFLKQDIDCGVDQAVRIGDDFSNKNGADATIVVPHDLPLLQPAHIDKISRSSEFCDKCIVICPSLRQDGTNILLQKPIGLIKTHYDDDSYTRHIEEALDAKASIFVVLSDNTMIDIDTKRDIEVLAKYKSNTSAALKYVRQTTTRWR